MKNYSYRDVEYFDFFFFFARQLDKHRLLLDYFYTCYVKTLFSCTFSRTDPRIRCLFFFFFFFYGENDNLFDFVIFFFLFFFSRLQYRRSTLATFTMRLPLIHVLLLVFLRYPRDNLSYVVIRLF